MMRVRTFLVVAIAGVSLGCEAVPDLTFSDASVTDSGIVLSDASQPDDASDSGDAGIDIDGSKSCNAPSGVEAGCCPPTVAPCVGLTCGPHCPDCVKLACKATEFCCAQLNGNGKYKNAMCTNDVSACP